MIFVSFYVFFFYFPCLNFNFQVGLNLIFSKNIEIIKIVVNLKSMIDNFSVFLHVSAEYPLNWTENSLESAPVDPY